MSVKRHWLPIRNWRFARLWLGQTASQVGTRMYQLSIAWWIVQDASGSEGFRLGMLFLIASLPAILFTRKIGGFVDRVSSRNLIFYVETLSGFVCLMLLLLPLLGFSSGAIGWAIYPVAFILALAQSLVDPAIFKMTPSILDPKDLEEGMGLVNSTQSVAGIAGAFFGALTIGTLGLTGSIIINAMSYFISALVLVFLDEAQGPAESKAVPKEESERGAELSKMEGYRLLRTVLFAFALVNFFLVPTLIIMPVFTKNVLMGSASLLGLLEAALAGGVLFGSIISKHFNGSESPFRIVTICVIACGLCLGIPVLMSNKIGYFVSIFGAGASLGLLNVKILTFFQKVVPVELKGRFFAQLNALTSATFPLAFFVFGFLVDYLPLTVLIGMQAIGIVVMSLVFMRFDSAARAVWRDLVWT
jgi:DHA3 family macrolide efflux protein-like MFS transporter